MANMLVHKCQACGGPLNMTAKGGKVQCPFCGSINYFQAEKTPGDGFLCPECGTLNPADALHCSECGAKTTLDCPKCGAVNPIGSAYCVKCGVNIKQENLRRESAQANLLLQQTLQKQRDEKSKRITKILAIITGSLAIIACCLLFYTTSLSPSAQATSTARALLELADTQTAVADLKAQYPYNGSNGAFSIFLQDFCVGHEASTGRDFVSIHLLHIQEDPKYASITWEFKNSTISDHLGNTFAVTQSDEYGDSRARIVADFDPRATAVTLHIRLADDSFEVISIPINLEDTLLTATCTE